MPTYEYACDACGKGFELEQRISDKPIKKCPKCGKLKARRMISGGAGFQLKGGGWYADGYGSSKSSSSNGSSDSAKTSDSTKTSDSAKTSGSTSSGASAD